MRDDRVPSELQRIAGFVRAHPEASRRVVDLPYRLASHATQDGTKHGKQM